MMECKTFKQWLNTEDKEYANKEALAYQHMDQCDACRNLHRLDAYATAHIQPAFAKTRPDDDLYSRIQADIDHIARQPVKNRPKLRRWFAPAIPALAMAGLILLVMLNPFGAKPVNLLQVERAVAAEHLRNDLAMNIRFDDTRSANTWLADTFAYPVVLPDFKGLGLDVKGGRECHLGGKKAVYLFCEKSGKKTSMFIINPSDVAFELSPEKRYRVADGQLDIEMWEANSLIYVLASVV